MSVQKFFCPTCGQPMKPIEKKTELSTSSHKFVKSTQFTKEIFKIWRCLNCDKEWYINFQKGTIEKRSASNTLE